MLPYGDETNSEFYGCWTSLLPWVKTMNMVLQQSEKANQISKLLLFLLPEENLIRVFWSWIHRLLKLWTTKQDQSLGHLFTDHGYTSNHEPWCFCFLYSVSEGNSNDWLQHLEYLECSAQELQIFQLRNLTRASSLTDPYIAHGQLSSFWSH